MDTKNVLSKVLSFTTVITLVFSSLVLMPSSVSADSVANPAILGSCGLDIALLADV